MVTNSIKFVGTWSLYTGMFWFWRRIRSHVKCIRYIDCCAEFLSSHCWIIKSLQMQTKYFGISKYGNLFLHIIYSFTLWTFVPASFHCFWLNVSFHQFTNIYISSVSNSFSWKTNTQIHKIIKSATFKSTTYTIHGTA